jgi:hypothetical protein
MKSHLMYKQKDFDSQQECQAQTETLIQDLELETLFNAMARGDDFLHGIVSKAILNYETDLEVIRYRQEIVQDCLRNPDIIRALYQIPVESIERKQKKWLGIYSRFPSGILSGAIDIMEMFVDLLQKLKTIADQHADKFASQGFKTFFSMVKEELDDDYFTLVKEHLEALTFSNGVMISAELGKGNEGTKYILREPPERRSWFKQILNLENREYSFSIHPRDDHSARAIGDLKNRGINLAANALAQSSDHIQSFINNMRIELAFYIGCINLSEDLMQIGENYCLPQPEPMDRLYHSAKGIYDICLALTMQQKTVSNNLKADQKDLVVITGANQGGKSTFLRAVGVAQLMMQVGMYVPADEYRANLRTQIFTHYKREEDASMESGKLDEELNRMSEIVDQISRDSILLLNESFSATNEREGSEIARQVVCALVEKQIKIFFVTHLYEFAYSLYRKNQKNFLFLRAQRKDDGERTYKLLEAEPLQVSYGVDLYNEIFNHEK